MDPDDKPDEVNPEGEPQNPESTGDGENGHIRHRQRVRKRIKIRKRVKIKRKTSPKKKARKLLETVAWVLVTAAFLVTLVILILQLDFNSKHRQKRKTVTEFRDSHPVFPELNHEKSTTPAWRL